MKKSFFACALGILLLLVSPLYATAKDARQKVEMPPMMQEHMLNNMRDHLHALQEIQAALAKSDFDKAADIAERRIGMSSLETHGAAHMAPYMPKPMQDIGMQMHRAASRFSRTAQDAVVKADMAIVLGDFSTLLRQCVACHDSYRLR
jgi:cytochrome c556